MNRKQFELIENCIKLLEEGASLEDCLSRFPDLTAETHKILEVTKAVIDLGINQVPAEAIISSRVKLLSGAKELSMKKAPIASDRGSGKLIDPFRRFVHLLAAIKPLSRRLVIILSITGLLILFSGGLVITSAKSLPGDSLYPVKRAVEDLRIHFVANKEARIEYEDNYNNERVVEVNKLLELKRMQPISFEGVVQSISEDFWMVSNIPVMVENGTTITGRSQKAPAIEPGMVVEVDGVTGGQGWISANEIRLRQYQFSGLVEKISAHSWQVSGIQLLITDDTQVDEDIIEGDEVMVSVRSEDDGIYAMAIRKGNQPSATDEDLPTPLSTPTDINSSDDEEYQFIGVMEEMSSDYWVVSGKVFYLNEDSQYEGNISLGDTLEIKYRIDAAGIYTAEEIKKTESKGSTEEFQPQETPTPGDGYEHHETPVITSTPNHGEQETPTPVWSETPKPTEDD